MKRDVLMFVLIKLLVFAPLFNGPKKHVLQQAVIYAALDGNDLAVSLFFNMWIVSKSSR